MTIRRARPRFPLVLAALAAIAIAGCRLGGATRDDAEEAPSAEAVNPVLAVTVARAVVAPMQSELRLLGVTEAFRHIILRAPVAGRVLGINVHVGDVVRRGQVVARVLSHEVEAAEQGVEIARKLDKADAAALAERVKRYADKSGIAVKAPDGGVVSKPPITSGQTVGYLDPLVDLIDPASVYVNAAVPLDELHLIKTGMSAAVVSPLEPGTDFPARVAAILPSFNPSSATSSVRIEFTSSRRIVETGAPVEVRIITRSIPDAIVIPAAALFQDTNSGYHVFVARDDGRAHRVPVTLGIQKPDKVQVSAGLRAGDNVITSGGYALSDGLRVTVAQDAQ